MKCSNLKRYFYNYTYYHLYLFFQFIFSTHFHTLIDYASYNSIINEIDPQGNYGLSCILKVKDQGQDMLLFLPTC